MKQIPLSEIDKKIKVVDFSLTKSGLWIAYLFAGKTIDLIATPEQTCDLFKKHLWIEDYSGAGSEVTVEHEWLSDGVDHEGDHIQRSGVTQSTFEEFVLGFELSQMDALQIAIGIEKDKAFNVAMENFSAIPKMIKIIGGDQQRNVVSMAEETLK